MPPLPPVLLCEGHQDDEFFKHLAEARKLTVPHIIPRKGPTPSGEGAFVFRLGGIPDERDIQKRRAIILVADNDDDPASKFRNVVEQIQKANDHRRKTIATAPLLGVPDQPRKLVDSESGLPQVAILMLPWDGVSGCLDTMCFEAAKHKRPELASSVEEYATRAGVSGWKLHKQHKMKLHCLLSGACPDEPCTALRYAWSGGRRPTDLIPLDDPCFDQVADFLKVL